MTDWSITDLHMQMCGAVSLRAAPRIVETRRARLGSQSSSTAGVVRDGKKNPAVSVV